MKVIGCAHISCDKIRGKCLFCINILPGRKKIRLGFPLHDVDIRQHFLHTTPYFLSLTILYMEGLPFKLFFRGLILF